jgi:glycosyltransferase involved in cell wall biosynthesis
VIPWGVEDKVIESYSSRVSQDFRFHVPLKVLVPRPHKKVYDNQFIVLSLLELLRSNKIALTFPDWGDNFDDFRALVHSNGIENSVNYYGFMPRDKYLGFMAGFDVYLSAAHSDSSPASLIEAMGAGLFPVVAEIDGVKEWLDGNNCLFFSHDAGETLASAFQKLLNHEIGINKILRHNHEMVKQKALFSKNIDDTIAIMETMIHHA